MRRLKVVPKLMTGKVLADAAVSASASESPSRKSLDSTLWAALLGGETVKQLDDLHYLIPNKLAFVVAASDAVNALKAGHRGQNLKFLVADFHLKYKPIAADFGPVNLGVLSRFYQFMAKKMQYGGTIVYCIEPCSDALANASFLLGAFLVLHAGKSAEEASRYFSRQNAPFVLRPFRDATFSRQDYELNLLDCLSGLEKAAIRLEWFSPDEFDADIYDEMSQCSVGKTHEISSKFVIVELSGPAFLPLKLAAEIDEMLTSTEQNPHFRRLGVSAVIRLNGPDCTPMREEVSSTRYYDLDFSDYGNIPPDRLLKKFLTICDREKVIAIHSRNTYDRAALLVACWIMKNAGFSANEAIAWLRIVRPGSIVGSQHQYLKAKEQAFKAEVERNATLILNKNLPSLSVSTSMIFQLEGPSSSGCESEEVTSVPRSNSWIGTDVMPETSPLSSTSPTAMSNAPLTSERSAFLSEFGPKALQAPPTVNPSVARSGMMTGWATLPNRFASKLMETQGQRAANINADLSPTQPSTLKLKPARPTPRRSTLVNSGSDTLVYVTPPQRRSAEQPLLTTPRKQESPPPRHSSPLPNSENPLRQRYINRAAFGRSDVMLDSGEVETGKAPKACNPPVFQRNPGCSIFLTPSPPSHTGNENGAGRLFHSLERRVSRKMSVEEELLSI